MGKPLRVEVAYALRDRQVLVTLEMEQGSTVRQAVERSGILLQFPEVALTRTRVGVFGKEVKLDTPLREGDRVEIYRTLIADPKEARRERAKLSRRREPKLSRRREPG
jgi:hypothetical protein